MGNVYHHPADFNGRVRHLPHMTRVQVIARIPFLVERASSYAFETYALLRRVHVLQQYLSCKKLQQNVSYNFFCSNTVVAKKTATRLVLRK